MIEPAPTMLTTAATTAPSRLLDRLRHETTAGLRSDRADRRSYATDASLDQVETVGVALLRTASDLAAAELVAVPRGTATRLSVQIVGEGSLRTRGLKFVMEVWGA